MPAFQLETFEVCPATETACLLRLSGRWTEGTPASASLLVDDGRDERAVAPLPAPARRSTEEGGIWRAAFAISRDEVRGRPAFALQGDAEVVDLPVPRERELRERAPVEPEGQPPIAEARRQALLHLEDELQAERAEHAEAVTRLEAAEIALEQASAAVDQERRDGDSLRSRLAEVESEAERLRVEYETTEAARSEAQRELDEHRSALVLVEAALDAQLQSAEVTEEELAALEHDREAETQSILRLVRTARAEEAPPRNAPFLRWEKTRERAARWASGRGRDGDPAGPETSDAATDSAASSEL